MSKLSEGFDGQVSVVWLSRTLMMPCLAFLGDALNTGSVHLLRVTHFISGLLSKLIQIPPFLADLY